MVETIAANAFSQLADALSSLDALACKYTAVQEENDRVTRFSKFSPSQSAFIAAFDLCAGDTDKLRELQNSRRTGIIELEIRAFNEAELRLQVQKAAETVKQLVQQALDYYHNHLPRTFHTPLAADIAIAIQAVQRLQAIKKEAGLRRPATNHWYQCRNSEECQAVVSNTLALLKSTVKAETNARGNCSIQTSVFDASVYPCNAAIGEGDFRFSRNWHHQQYQGLTTVAVLPSNIELTAPSCLTLQQACHDITCAEQNMAAALEELLQRFRATDLKPNRLTLALQKARSDEEIAAVASERRKVTHENRYEYSAFLALLSAAQKLRDARAMALPIMEQALGEVEELGKKPRYEVPNSDRHFEAGVYLLYCADLLLRRSGQNLQSIGNNKAFMERYQVMQNDISSLIDEVSAFVRD